MPIDSNNFNGWRRTGGSIKHGRSKVLLMQMRPRSATRPSKQSLDQQIVYFIPWTLKMATLWSSTMKNPVSMGLFYFCWSTTLNPSHTPWHYTFLSRSWGGNEASGPDGIPAELLKNSGEAITWRSRCNLLHRLRHLIASPVHGPPTRYFSNGRMQTLSQYRTVYG